MSATFYYKTMGKGKEAKIGQSHFFKPSNVPHIKGKKCTSTQQTKPPEVCYIRTWDRFEKAMQIPIMLTLLLETVSPCVNCCGPSQEVSWRQRNIWKGLWC